MASAFVECDEHFARGIALVNATLGRSQAVRQGPLKPPFPGSIPGGPANYLSQNGEVSSNDLKFPILTSPF